VPPGAPCVTPPPMPLPFGLASHRYSVYLLYWYKNTNTDATRHQTPPDVAASHAAPTATLIRFTCFTGTKVQIPDAHSFFFTVDPTSCRGISRGTYTSSPSPAAARARR
jgi:hypothetical protein